MSVPACLSWWSIAGPFTSKFWYLQIDDMDISDKNATFFLKVLFLPTQGDPAKAPAQTPGRDLKCDGSGNRDRSRHPPATTTKDV